MRWTGIPWLTLALVLGTRIAGASSPLDSLVLTPVSPVTLDLTGAAGEQVVPARAAVRYDASGIALVPLGLPDPPTGAGPGVRAYHEGADGSIYFSLSASETLAGTTYQPSDVIRWDGISYTRHFHGLAEGVPAGVGIAAYAQDTSGTDLLAFNGSFSAPSGLAISPRDVIAWPTGAAPPSVWLSPGLPVGAGIGIDGLSVLDNGRVLLSFSSDVVFAGALRADEDVLEHDPTSGSWELAVDTSDLDPDWAAAGVNALYAKSGTANVGVPDPVTVRMLIVNADVSPRSYELRLDCGPHRVRDIAFGISLTPDVPPERIAIGSCGPTGCVPGVPATGFGPTVDPTTVVVEFSPDPAAQRDDAIYVELAGTRGGLLCQPGQDVLLAEVETTGGPAVGFLPAPLPTGEGAAASHRSGGAELPGRLIKYLAGALNPILSVNVRPPCQLETDQVFDVILTADVRLHQLGVALVLPDGMSAADVSFEGCTTLEDPDLNERSCDGAALLGEYVDAASSSTVGPSAVLATGGGHPGAIYLTLRGSALTEGLAALNFPGRPSLLGRIRYSPALPTPPRDPPLVLVAGRGFADAYMVPWDPFDGDTIPYSGGTGFGSSEGVDIDADGLCDDIDLCIGSANNSDSGGVGLTPPTSAQDGIGDDCQCGDVTNLELELMPGGICGANTGVTLPGIVNQNDLTGIRCALTGAQTLPTSLVRKCNVRGPVDATLSQLGLRSDCELSDTVVLRRRLANEAVNPPDLQQCAAP